MDSSLQLSLVNYKRGAYIIVEGNQNADHFYIIKSGSVRISKEVEVIEEKGGNVLSPGDFFGVVATMSGHSHIETAQALTDVTVVAVHREQYGQLIEKNSPVALKIIQQFSMKMRYLDEALTRISLKGDESSGNIAHLFNVAEYYAKQGMYNLAYYAYYKYILNSPQGEHVAQSKERMSKIQPYAQAVHLEANTDSFTRTYPKDCMIFSEGEPGLDLYIIQKGSVKIAKIVNNKEVLLAVLKAGDIFGEMSILEDKPRSASAIAHDECVLMAVNKANFTRMIPTQPQIVTRLTELLAERIWAVYRQLGNTNMSDPIGRMYDSLLIQLEKQRVPINSDSHSFSFGPIELINMLGLSKEEGASAIRKLFENNKFKIVDNRIQVSEKVEIEKQVKYYRKMEKIESARREGSNSNR